MEISTIGFARKTAAEFFGALRAAGIRRLVDVRLNNSSQLAGFTKQCDLPFFLRELCAAEYIHEPLLAPTHEILDDFKKKRATWDDYERRFRALLDERRVDERLGRALFEQPAVLLCSEPKPDKCHRRLVAEYLQLKWGNVTVVHL